MKKEVKFKSAMHLTFFLVFLLTGVTCLIGSIWNPAHLVFAIGCGIAAPVTYKTKEW